MACRTFGLADNSVAIICSRGRRRQKCSVELCGKDSVALCDYPVERNGKKTTCDSPMCAMHRHTVGTVLDIDWCENHWQHEQRQRWPKGKR